MASRAAAALENARLYRDIQERDLRKNEFLAMLAHELRNPLAPIRNAVLILQQIPGKDSDVQWAGDVIDRQVKQMVRLVDDLLDVLRITRGKVQLKTEPFDVAAAVSIAVETSRPLIDERRHDLMCDFAAAAVMGDGGPGPLAQILANLLNNAAKYTPEGGRITLATSAKARTPSSASATRASALPRKCCPAFSIYSHRWTAHSIGLEGGLGIGLTLVHQLVEMHRGTVQAFSEGHGRGSEFVVRMPAVVAPGAGEEPAANSKPSPARQTDGLRVLVVDDNRDSARSLALLLETQGHQVQTAYDGLAGIEAVDAFEPDAVVLDIGLPGLNGYEVARRIRARLDGKPLMLVALTGYGHEDSRLQAQAAGFDLHLVKPVELQVLQQLLTDRFKTPPTGYSRLLTSNF